MLDDALALIGRDKAERRRAKCRKSSASGRWAEREEFGGFRDDMGAKAARGSSIMVPTR